MVASAACSLKTRETLVSIILLSICCILGTMGCSRFLYIIFLAPHKHYLSY